MESCLTLPGGQHRCTLLRTQQQTPDFSKLIKDRDTLLEAAEVSLREDENVTLLWLTVLRVPFLTSYFLKSRKLQPKSTRHYIQLFKGYYFNDFMFGVEQVKGFHYFLQTKECLSCVPFPPQMTDTTDLLYLRQTMIIILCFISLMSVMRNPSS